MMKTVGIATIMISVFMTGFFKYYKLKMRPLGLLMFVEFLNLYNRELKWSRKSIPEILETFDFKKFGLYLDSVRDLIVNNLYEQAFIEENKYIQNLYLTGNDKEILKCFFEKTGKSGLETEIALCEKTILELEQKKQEADAEFKKLGTLSLKLSLVCSVWLGIMLI